MGTEDQRNSGNRKIVGTDDEWVQMTSGTVGTEDQRNSRNRGTETQGIEEQRNRGTEEQKNRGTEGTKEQ